ncbi:MAG TPA: hypothetical protein VKE98_17315 [Gemmataceae bacterium]|nr:hypothetical protein [Gemmataceae bacterium]
MTAYRCIFALAALYNTAFGIWAGFFPLSFFILFDLDPPRYPAIWSCVGMVVGVYAIAYAHVAWKPEQGTVFVIIGFVGKILGPIGWVVAVWSGELPARTFLLILANDLVWWFPFLFYLLRDFPNRSRLIAWIVVAVHIPACLGLIAVAGGTEIVADMAQRRDWVGNHVPLWVLTWFLWALASMSLGAFVLVWTGRLLEVHVPRFWTIIGCAVVLIGIPFDLAGECVNVMALTQPGISVDEFAHVARLYGILSAVIANGLYCLGGLILSGVSWQAGWLRGRLGILGLVMWSVGILLTLTAIIDFRMGMVVSGGAVMALFIPWAAMVGWRLTANSLSRCTIPS